MCSKIEFCRIQDFVSKPLNWIPKKINLAIDEILFVVLFHFICKLTTFKKNNDQIDFLDKAWLSVKLNSLSKKKKKSAIHENFFP